MERWQWRAIMGWFGGGGEWFGFELKDLNGSKSTMRIQIPLEKRPHTLETMVVPHTLTILPILVLYGGVRMGDSRSVTSMEHS